MNGDQYCYYVKSVGDIRPAGFVDPIINFSQISLRDTVSITSRPVRPVLTVDDQLRPGHQHAELGQPPDTGLRHVMWQNTSSILLPLEGSRFHAA
ncbi:MAG: hypothetical protein MZV63_16950 [Marinilabiliales bacterium]|nr:hypothetical protein [Marinilabiliales bacterium]